MCILFDISVFYWKVNVCSKGNEIDAMLAQVNNCTREQQNKFLEEDELKLFYALYTVPANPTNKKANSKTAGALAHCIAMRQFISEKLFRLCSQKIARSCNLVLIMIAISLNL